jgi:hypothetical protein
MMEHWTTKLRPWIEDPSQPRFVRELLEAGRSDLAGYDLEQGFRTHLARVAVGAPMPDWADGLRSSAPTAGASSTTAGSAMMGWLAVLVAVTFALMLASRRTEMPRGATPESVVATAQQALPPGSVAAPLSAPVAVGSETPAVREQAASTPPPPAPDAERVKRNDKPAEARSARPGAKAPSARKGDGARSGGAASAKMIEGPASSELFESARPAAPLAQGATPEQAPEQVGRPQALAVAEGMDKPQQASGDSATPQQARQAPQDDAALEREMMMLAVAQRALASDPARALELAHQGEHEFAGSMFTQERQQVLLLALVKLGRLDEAKRLAKPFLARYRQGPFSDRVRRALATGKVER